MPVRSSGPTVARRRLGTALRDLREKANIRLDAAARELECSPAKISRLENGHGFARAADVHALLDLYQNRLFETGYRDPALRSKFDSWLAQTKSARWWESVADLLDDDEDRLLAIETEAVRLHIFHTVMVPPILQTENYARAHLQAKRPSLSRPDVDRLIALQQARQQPFLNARNNLSLSVILDEAAVRRRVGSTETLSAQLAWLTSVLDQQKDRARGQIELQILPFSAGVPGGTQDHSASSNLDTQDLIPLWDTSTVSAAVVGTKARQTSQHSKASSGH